MATKEKGKARRKAAQPIRLDFKSVQQVVVTGPDGGRFVVTAKEAALACRSDLDEKAWQHEFEGFLALLNGWCASRHDRVKSAYVGISSEGLTVVIVTKGSDYLFDFDDEVTNLDIQLAKIHPQVRATCCNRQTQSPCPAYPTLILKEHCRYMGTKNDHREKADHNQKFLDSIAKEFPDWKVTVIFYKALHLVECFLRSMVGIATITVIGTMCSKGTMSISGLTICQSTHNPGEHVTRSSISPETVEYVHGRLAKVEATLASKMS